MMLPPVSLYIHFPWCVRRCPYCDFNSHVQPENLGTVQKQYLQALLTDLSVMAKAVQERQIQSIFIGGGTPSLMSPDILADLLAEVRVQLSLSHSCEITIEANPGTFEKDRFLAFQQAGVNRLSLGVQSLNDQKLNALGRIHNAAQAVAAIEEAQKTFKSFNLDLMYALPEQTLEEFQFDLSKVLAFEPPHLSLYHLTIEPNTYFAKYPPRLPDDDLASFMLDHITQHCASVGLQRYEVSAYARHGFECKHNKNYWEYGDYIGIGAGAHGKLTIPVINGKEVLKKIIRHIKYRDPMLYMQKALCGEATAQTQEVLPEELPFEFMLGALRLKEGVRAELFEQRTGLALDKIGAQLQKAIALGLLSPDLHQLKATSKGFDFLSNLQELFLSEKEYNKNGLANDNRV